MDRLPDPTSPSPDEKDALVRALWAHGAAPAAGGAGLPAPPSPSHDEKDALVGALWAQVQALTAWVAELEAKLGVPPKTPDTSRLPPSAGKERSRGATPARA